MNTVKSLNHTKRECKYHIVWIPKYRKKSIYKELRPYLGDILKELASQKECTIEEGHLQSDHVHILISIPPKYSVAQIVGFIKKCDFNSKNVFWKKKEFHGSEFLGAGILCNDSRS